MLKGLMEGVSHGALDFMQPQDQWDYATSMGFPGIGGGGGGGNLHNPFYSLHQPSLPTVVDQRNNTSFIQGNELSEWVEHATKEIIQDHQLPDDSDIVGGGGLFDDHTTRILSEHFPGMLSEIRPNKVARRGSSHDNIDAAASQQQQQNNQWGCEGEINNGGQISCVSKGLLINNGGGGGVEEKSLSLMTRLMECAVALSAENLDEVDNMLLEVTQMASPYGPSCAERVVAYFSKAMGSRVINSRLGMSSPLINHKSIHSCFEVYDNIAPFVKFGHFPCNQAILESIHKGDRIHIIDLDIMQGLQWPTLLHILSTRVEGPPLVRITGMGTSIDILIETGKKLCDFAKRVGLPFEFHPLARKFGDIDPSMLQIRRGEAVAVHWSQHSLYDATGPDWKTLRLLQEISPHIITLVEQEITHDGAFLDRFVGSLHFYSTIFDSLGAYLRSDDESRHRVEHGLFYREINNILAIGGPARSGEDKFGNWRGELVKNGFMQVPMSTICMAQGQLILNMYPPSNGYSLVQGDGTLRLGWKETSLYSVSAWTSPVYRYN